MEQRELSSLSDPLSKAAEAPPEGSTAARGRGNASPSLSSSSHRERRELFERQLSSTLTSTSSGSIDMGNLRALASAGLPENTRAVGWKLLLGYLPPRRSEWAKTLEEKRARYAEFCSSFVVAAPGASVGGGGGGGGGEAPPQPSAAATSEDDHPLSQAPDSQWSSYFRDADLIAQIARDVARTHPGMHFFGGGGERKKKGKSGFGGRANNGERASRRAEMARALLVFAKLNPGLAYVQGMNEVLAPLYYHCALEEEEEEEEDKEEKQDGNGEAAAGTTATEQERTKTETSPQERAPSRTLSPGGMETALPLTVRQNRTAAIFF